MKFSIVALSCLAQLPLNTGLNTGLDTGMNTSSKDKWWDDCENEQVKRDRSTRCVSPGDEGKNQLACFGCGTFGGDTHPHCDVQCCDPSAPKPHGRCACTHYKSSYANGINHHDNTKCCAKDKAGHSVGVNGICGCSAVGSRPKYGGFNSDCCSGVWEHEVCVKRHCNTKGKSGNCCTTSDGQSPQHDGKCGCFHHKTTPNENEHVDGSNCCSGSLDAAGQCGCIKDDSKALPAGAEKGDCCSGETMDKDQVTYCKAATCTANGGKIGGGKHCCSGKDDAGTCVCVPPGGDAPANADDCCSGKAEGGKCVHLEKGELVRDGIDVSVCASGKVDSKGMCTCIHGRSNSPDAKYCCSDSLDTDGQCVCVSGGE